MIHSGGIRDQSRKLSEIASNFGRFLSSQNFVGDNPSNICVHVITPASSYVPYVPTVKFHEVIPTIAKVIGVNMLTFKADI